MSRFLRILACRLRGRHGVELDGWGYGLAGMVDLYCDRCGTRFTQVPLEDFDQMDLVIEMTNRGA